MTNHTEQSEVNDGYIMREVMNILAVTNARSIHAIKLTNLFTSEREKAVREVLDKLLEHGHGGGNWRRLIEQSYPTLPNRKGEE